MGGMVGHNAGLILADCNNTDNESCNSMVQCLYYIYLIITSLSKYANEYLE